VFISIWDCMNINTVIDVPISPKIQINELCKSKRTPLFSCRSEIEATIWVQNVKSEMNKNKRTLKLWKSENSIGCKTQKFETAKNKRTPNLCA